MMNNNIQPNEYIDAKLHSKARNTSEPARPDKIQSSQNQCSMLLQACIFFSFIQFSRYHHRIENLKRKNQQEINTCRFVWMCVSLFVENWFMKCLHTLTHHETLVVYNYTENKPNRLRIANSTEANLL